MAIDPFWQKILNRPGPVLDPVSRLSEVIFGLIMVLTFTGSISAASAGREEIGIVLWAALGCNVAWGIVDAFMYLMSLVMERGYAAAALKKVRTGNTAEATDTLKDYLPPVMTVVMKPDQFTQIQQELKSLPELPKRIPITWKDTRAAIQIFILVTLSTFPCTIPFLLIKDPMTAMRVSNGVALTLLFLTGFQLGRRAGYSPWLFGFLVALLGAALVAITIVLGG